MFRWNIRFLLAGNDQLGPVRRIENVSKVWIKRLIHYLINPGLANASLDAEKNALDINIYRKVCDIDI